MEVVLSLYWSSFPCKGDGLTLGRVELNQLVLFPFLDTVAVGSDGCWCTSRKPHIKGMRTSSFFTGK